MTAPHAGPDRPLPSGGAESFPYLYAKTRRFSVGLPRNITVLPDGRVLFLRTRDGDDPLLCLWRLDTASGREELLVDPAKLQAPGEDELPAAERARRERARESGAGIVAYATDQAGRRACFGLAGGLYVVDVDSGQIESPPAGGSVFDPRLSPDGSMVAYVAGDELRVTSVTGLDSEGDEATIEDRTVVAPLEPSVSMGRAEFIAAEEMQRSRGYWWSPNSDQLLVTRVDEAPVGQWWIADPAHPGVEPNEIRYPAAGTANAQVGLLLVNLNGDRRSIEWDDGGRFEYLANVLWPAGHDPLVVRQSRDQREVSIATIDLESLTLTDRRLITDDVWVELIPSSPTVCEHGLLTVEDLGPASGRGQGAGARPGVGRRALLLDGTPLTDGTVNVRSVVGVIGDRVMISGWTEPTEIHLFMVDLDRDPDGDPQSPRPLTTIPGVYNATIGGALDDTAVEGSQAIAVVSGARPTADGLEVAVRPILLPESGDPEPEPDTHTDTDPDAMPPTATMGRTVPSLGAPIAFIEDLSDRPPIKAVPAFCQLGADRLESALFLPSGFEGDRRLPVLLDPYGGPHAQRVLKTQTAHLVSQWFAEHGFAVLVTDGRGTPGRGPGWERQVWGDLAGPVLEDQLAALDAAADEFGVLDLDRVAIRGWSFGGYLAALAVMRQPDRFHAAVAGAPVTDWRLYDTHYTERYLGRPDLNPRHYDTTDLTAEADKLTRPLLLIHGLADDNVVAAHTLRLSTALLGAAVPHRVLPLSGVTHMTPQEAVAENLLWLQLDFLRNALKLDEAAPKAPPIRRDP